MPPPQPRRSTPTRTQGLLLAGLAIVAIWLIARSSSSPSPSQSPAVRHDTVHGKPAFRQRLVAVGDLHGDLDNAQKVLRMAKIIDGDASWIGGTDILVQTGDIVDRGTYAWEIYRMMQRLRDEAASAGGSVVSVLGNHEVMNAIGDWRYVTPDDIKHTGGAQQRRRDLSVDGWLGQEWLANYTVTARVPLGPHPSSPTLSFTHGSLRPSYPDLLPYPSRINSLGHSLLLKALTPPLAPPYPPNPYAGLPKGHSQSEAALYDAGGPLWWRGLAETPSDKVVCAWADELRDKLAVRRIIGGHTPDFERIVHRCNTSVIIIDTGISSAYGGVLSALEIVYTLTPVDAEPATDHSDDTDHSNHADQPHSPDHRQDPFVAGGNDGEDVEAVWYSHGLVKGRSYWEREEVTAVYEKKRHVIAVEEREVIL